MTTNHNPIIAALKLSTVAAALVLAGCSDSLNDMEVIGQEQFMDKPEVRKQMLADCESKAPSDPSDAIEFLQTKFGQSCDNAKKAEEIAAVHKAYIEQSRKAAENDRKLFSSN